MKNKTYNVTMLTKSPIFIGSGEVLGQLNYYANNDQVAIIDENKFCNTLTEQQITNFADYCLKGSASLYNWCSSNKLNADSDIYKYKIKVEKFKINSKSPNSLNEISTFIKTVGQPYIPGSSLKGAIRTAYLGHNGREDVKGNDDKIFNTLQISDSDPIAFEELYVTQRLDLVLHRIGQVRKNESKEFNALPIYFEFLKPETKINFRLNLTDDTLNIDAIKEALEYFADSRLEDPVNIQSFLNKSSETIKTIQGANLYFGGQSGFFNKSNLYDNSNDWLSDVVKILSSKFDRPPLKHNHKEIDRKEEISPHTIHLAQYENQLYPIGFANLKFKEI